MNVNDFGCSVTIGVTVNACEFPKKTHITTTLSTKELVNE